jgi:DNA-binding transcriptional LysR family regulator
LPTAAPTTIDFRHLRYYLAVVEELHFGRAAERMHISQPPLSQAIRRLEDELGVRLLDRNSRTVTVTEAGRVFAEEARRVLTNFDVAVAEARHAGGATATVRIGCVSHLPLERLHRLLDGIRELCPSSRPQVTHLYTLEQIAWLAAGELDLAIFTRAEEHADVVTEPLFPGEQLAIHLPKPHRLASQLVVRPEDVEGEDLVLFPRRVNPALHDHILRQARDAGYRFREVREAGGAAPRDITSAVAGGLGLALEPPSFTQVAGSDRLVSRRALDPPLVLPDTVVAWRANPPRHLRPVIGAVRDMARGIREPDRGRDHDDAEHP